MGVHSFGWKGIGKNDSLDGLLEIQGSAEGV
jgi:hypothetical protein